MNTNKISIQELICYVDNKYNLNINSDTNKKIKDFNDLNNPDDNNNNIIRYNFPPTSFLYNIFRDYEYSILSIQYNLDANKNFYAYLISNINKLIVDDKFNVDEIFLDKYIKNISNKNILYKDKILKYDTSYDTITYLANLFHINILLLDIKNDKIINHNDYFIPYKKTIIIINDINDYKLMILDQNGGNFYFSYKDNIIKDLIEQSYLIQNFVVVWNENLDKYINHINDNINDNIDENINRTMSVTKLRKLADNIGISIYRKDNIKKTKNELYNNIKNKLKNNID